MLRRLFARGAADPLTGLVPEQTRLIVGLGNPGPEFAWTRHNLGFRCVDALATRFTAAWADRRDGLESLVAVIRPAADRTIVLAKPLTFMNHSGEAVSRLLDRLGLDPQGCLVVYDDMDLPWRALRLRQRGSPGTHNGMRSVVSSLSTEAIPRLRIGIGQAAPGGAISHVLSEFNDRDSAAVQGVIERSSAAALDWGLHGAATAMNRYNKT